MINHTGYLRVLKIIIPYFGVMVLFQLIGYAVIGVHFLDGDQPRAIWEITVIACSSMLGTLAIVWIWNNYVDQALRWNFEFDVLGAKLGLVVPIAILLFGFFILVVMDQIQIIGHVVDWKGLVLSVFLFVFVSISEEVLMRYYVLKNLMISFHPVVALIVTSMVFALMHFSNPSFSFLPCINLFLAGVFLGTPYIFNRNLTFPIVGHFFWNFLQGPVLGFEVSGKDLNAFLSIEMLGEKELLTGGGFGFEGSIICTILLLLGILLVWKIYYSSTNIYGRK